MAPSSANVSGKAATAEHWLVDELSKRYDIARQIEQALAENLKRLVPSSLFRGADQRAWRR